MDYGDDKKCLSVLLGNINLDFTSGCIICACAVDDLLYVRWWLIGVFSKYDAVFGEWGERHKYVGHLDLQGTQGN